MNLPNKLTVLRVILIPFFVVFLLLSPGNDLFKWISLAIFIIASLTDMLDGKIARKYNLITDFGKFMDPLADKLLVCSAMICLIDLGKIPSWVVVIIIAREFIRVEFYSRKDQQQHGCRRSFHTDVAVAVAGHGQQYKIQKCRGCWARRPSISTGNNAI